MSRKFLGLMLVGGVAVAGGLAATSDDANAGHRHRHGGWGSCGFAACGHGGFEYDDDDACGWSACGHGGGWCGGYAGYGYSGCGYSSCGYGYGGPTHYIRRTTTTTYRHYHPAPSCATSHYGYSGYSSCNRPAYQGYYGGY